MVGSWYKFMDIGIIHFMAYPEVQKEGGPVVETLEKILKDDFFTAVEITHIRDGKACEQVKNMIEQSHVVAAFGAQPVLLSGKLNINALDETERIKAVDEVKKCIEEASYLGTKGVAVLSGPYPGKEKEKEALRQLYKSLDELCLYSSKFELGFELETFDFDIDKKCLIGGSDIAAEVAQEVRKNHNNFGLLVDLSHLPLQYETSKKAIKTCASYITHLHIGNCVMKDKNHPAYGDMHPRFGVKGGENDVKEVREFLEAAFESGLLNDVKRPILSFEVKPMPGESSDLIVANAKRTLPHGVVVIIAYLVYADFFKVFKNDSYFES